MRKRPVSSGAESGAVLFLVLLLMAVLALGAFAMARMTEVRLGVATNTVLKDQAAQVAEVGVNSAVQALRDLQDYSLDVAPWYFAAARSTTSESGLPEGISWDSLTSLDVSGFDVRYVVERLCQSASQNAPPAAPSASSAATMKCATKDVGQLYESADANRASLGSQVLVYFRVTVRVTGPRNTLTIVQSLVTQT